jgi:hypothetical protein
MNSHALPRLFAVVLTFVLVTIGLASTPARAAETTQWSETITRSNVLVQDCHGPSVVSGFSPTLAFGLNFEVATSYKLDRDFTVIEHNTGINHPVVERQIVTIAGIVANSETGRSLAYDGHFARTTNYKEGDVAITSLELRLIRSDEKDVTITVDRDGSGLIDSPEALLLAYAPRGLHMSLCSYFAGLKVAG